MKHTLMPVNIGSEKSAAMAASGAYLPSEVSLKLK